MQDKLLSIIIPVYNSELFLQKCVDSIIDAIGKNSLLCEVLLINDGSKDNSYKICEEYVKNYNFIKAFHKENGGVSSARNLGIKKSQGKFITFIDSDDYVTNDFYKVFNILQNDYETEVFSFGITRGNKIISNYNKTLFPQNIDDVIWFVENDITTSSCVKIVKTEFIRKNNLYFTNTTKSEDFEWSIRGLLLSSKYKCLDICYYVYYINNDSATFSDKAKGFVDHFTNVRSIFDLLSNIKTTNKKKKTLFSGLFQNNYHYLTRIRKTQKSERKAIADIFIKNKDLYFYPRKKSYRILYFMLKLIGIKATLKLLSVIRK